MPATGEELAFGIDCLSVGRGDMAPRGVRLPSRPVRGWPGERIDQVWVAILAELAEVGRLSWRDAGASAALQASVRQLSKRVAQLEECVSRNVVIHTLAPEPYELVKPISALLRRQGDEWVASFHEAAVSASGETEEQALWNLKDLILLTYETLAEYPPERLGPLPTRQLAVLRALIRECC